MTHTKTPMLLLDNIRFQLPHKTLLEAVSLRAHIGEIVGLLGINGAGKSTTLKIAANILYATAGKRYAPPASLIGYVPESPPLIPTWRVDAFLKHMANMRGLSKTAAKSAIERVTHDLSLTDILPERIESLSKGNRQRLAIAQALLHHPKLLILDEPTSGLDPKQIYLFRTLLNQIKSETAIILSSHIMQEVSALCDQIVIIHEGKSVKTLDLSNNAKHLVIEFYMPIDDSHFAHFPTWQGSKGFFHHFILQDDGEKNALIATCFDHGFPIKSIAGLERLIENEFLTQIGYHQEELP